MIAGSYIWNGLPRSLIGRRLAPNVPGRTSSTISYRVIGFSVDTIRVESPGRERSELALSVLRDAITSGTLVFVDDPI